MPWLTPVPLIAAVVVYGVCLSRRRPVVGLIGLLGFGAGYLAVVLDDERGANSAWHLVWLLGLAVLAVALIPRARAGSWWDRTFGRTDWAVAAAAAPVVFVLALTLPFVGTGPSGPPDPVQVAIGYILLASTVVAVLLPVIAGLAALVSRNRRWQSFALLTGTLGFVMLSLGAAYAAGAFGF